MYEVVLFDHRFNRIENRNNKAIQIKLQNNRKYSKNSERVMFKESLYVSKTIEGVWLITEVLKYIKK